MRRGAAVLDATRAIERNETGVVSGGGLSFRWSRSKSLRFLRARCLSAAKLAADPRNTGSGDRVFGSGGELRVR